jgi:hypothetical protein
VGRLLVVRCESPRGAAGDTCLRPTAGAVSVPLEDPLVRGLRSAAPGFRAGLARVEIAHVGGSSSCDPVELLQPAAVGRLVGALRRAGNVRREQRPHTRNRAPPPIPSRMTAGTRQTYPYPNRPRAHRRYACRPSVDRSAQASDQRDPISLEDLCGHNRGGGTRDAGALIAFEGSERAAVALVARERECSEPLSVPAAVARRPQAGSIDAVLRADGVEVVPLDDRGAGCWSAVRDGGCHRCNGGAVRANSRATSDPDDLRHLDASLVLIGM